MHSPISILGLVTTFATLSSAHTVVTNLFIDDVNQGDGTCVRMPKDGATCTAPIRGVETNTDMVCGRDGLNPVAFTCPASAGSKVSFEFRMYADLSQPGYLDPSHKGPVSIYLKAVSDMSASAQGDGWFKIFDEGYNTATNLFGTETMMKQQGLLSVQLPTGLPTGYYLIRTELLALQNVTGTASGPVVDPQFYVQCAQLFVQGSSTGTLDIPAANKVSIPGHVSYSEPALNFNLYDQPLKLPYSAPGPKPFFPSSGGSSTNIKAITPLPASQGGIPADCILKNANWCAVEVPSYTNEDGCWASTENCYKQVDACYKSAPPSGFKGCAKLNAQKCDVLRDSCSAKQFTGPPNKDQKLGDTIARQVSPSEIPPPGKVEGAVTEGGTTTGGGNTGSSPTSSETAPSATATASPGTGTGSGSGSGSGTGTETGTDTGYGSGNGAGAGAGAGAGPSAGTPTTTTISPPAATTSVIRGKCHKKTHKKRKLHRHQRHQL